MAEYLEKEGLKKSITSLLAIKGITPDIKQLVIAIIDGEMLADVQPVDMWISVEDSLPEERKCVLVYDGGVCIAWRYKGEWESDDYTLATVAYWQPLPEPPVNE